MSTNTCRVLEQSNVSMSIISLCVYIYFQDYFTQVPSIIHISVSFVGVRKSIFWKIERDTSKICFFIKRCKRPVGLGLWMEKFKDDHFPSAEYLDILAISCDSFDEQVNVLIGRGQGKKNHVQNLQKLRTWCRDYRVAFKINSVINRFNVEEDMREQIKALNPVRWKVSSWCCVCWL